MYYEIKEFYNILSQKIRSWKRKNYKIIVCGDFNVDTNNPKISLKKDLESKFVNVNKLYNHPVSGYTFRRGDSKSNLDHTYSSPKNVIFAIYKGISLGGSIEHPVPDHLPIMIILQTKKNECNLKDRKVYKWNLIEDDKWKKIENNLILKTKLYIENGNPTSQEMMNLMCNYYYDIRENNSVHFFVKHNSIPYFTNKLKEIKNKLKKMRRLRYHKKKYVKFDKDEYTSLRLQYKKELNLQREKYLYKMKRQICNSTDPGTLSKNMKILINRKISPPILINSKTGEIPKNTLESLNNLNEDFVNVGDSARKNEYDETFIKNKKKEVQNLLNNMKIGSHEWKIK